MVKQHNLSTVLENGALSFRKTQLEFEPQFLLKNKSCSFTLSSGNEKQDFTQVFSNLVGDLVRKRVNSTPNHS